MNRERSYLSILNSLRIFLGASLRYWVPSVSVTKTALSSGTFWSRAAKIWKNLSCCAVLLKLLCLRTWFNIWRASVRRAFSGGCVRISPTCFSTWATSLTDPGWVIEVGAVTVWAVASCVVLAINPIPISAVVSLLGSNFFALDKRLGVWGEFDDVGVFMGTSYHGFLEKSKICIRNKHVI